MSGTFTYLCYHLIFSTKERRPFIDPILSPRLYEYIGGIINTLDGKPIIMNGPSDHIHILCFISKNISISDFMRTIKSNSSKWIHDTYNDKKDFMWQEGYGAFTVSDSQIERVVEYIKKQQEHHKTISFKEEYIRILKKLGIEYNEKYVWK